MFELTTFFIISQVLVFIAMIFDFLSLQFKKRQHIFLNLIVSASLISVHYFLLNKVAAGVIIFFSVIRFITCYFTTNKKFLYGFIALNTISLFFTYMEVFDLIIYFGLLFIIVGNFQEDTKRMRQLMMIGTSTLIVYNFIIFSPMAVVVEASFLISNIIGYYRHHIRRKVHLQ
jgi:hypothetical protein